MKVAVLFSGGKDSTFSAYEVKRKGYDLRYLITMVPENPESYMFHHPDTHLAEMLAKSMGIPIVVQHTKGRKEEELEDLRKAIMRVRSDVDGIVAGGLASKYQLDRIVRVVQGVRLKAITPIWGVDIRKYWRILRASGFKVMIVGVACEGLGREWLGRVMDEQAIAELEKLSEKYGFNLGGEGGEFETLVLDAPLFRQELVVLGGKKTWEEDSGVYHIEEAVLINKKQLASLRSAYAKRKPEIRRRLDDFRKVWKGSEKAVFAELSFCLCTPQSKAVNCNEAINRLAVSGHLHDAKADARALASRMKGVRFHNNKARWIAGARKLFTGPDGSLRIKGRINPSDIMATREWLVANVKGLGYKEASHFLRNIGFGQDVAILDRHILKNLNMLGLISELPDSLSPAAYKSMEERMRKFSKGIGIPLEELDLVFWSEETGHVFK